MRAECFPVLLDFLTYHETIKNHSKKTVEEYFFDLRLFFRFLKAHKGLSDSPDLDDVTISDIDARFIERISLSDAYAFLSYLSGERENHNGKQPGDLGLGAPARARKVASVRSFFKYCAMKAHVIEKNPMLELDSPKLRRDLPRFLTEEDSIALLRSIGGMHKERDFAIIILFLNCGLRISELQGLNMQDIQGDTIRVLGKGNKVRILYLAPACIEAIERYKEVRPPVGEKVTALFLSSRLRRISTKTVHIIVKKHIAAAGLDQTRYSSHKLRHTAATLMLENGVDIRTLQELLGHENLNTTQIYTHVSSTQLREAARANPLSRFKPED
ncbi:MAG: tyrosine recombinase XerC [Oscillospiraceae bacterium]|jgi:site-specific recombinase XerD|nr:tyrosine recombinase XerC [Oscillospiraceae bacterium]